MFTKNSTNKIFFLEILKGSLLIVFVWFGVLKIYGYSPVQYLILASTPSILANLPYFVFFLGLFEVIIGLLFLFPRFIKFAGAIAATHLFIASLLVITTQGFKPSFPVLTLEGEFVVKNLVLIAAALSISFSQKD